MSLRVESGFDHLTQAMAETLTKDVEFPVGMIVTVLGAKVTANTAHAKIVLSVFPTNREKEALEALRLFNREIKFGLSKRLRLRRIPELHYSFDATEAIASDVESVIEALRKKGEIE